MGVCGTDFTQVGIMTPRAERHMRPVIPINAHTSLLTQGTETSRPAQATVMSRRNEFGNSGMSLCDEL